MEAQTRLESDMKLPPIVEVPRALPETRCPLGDPCLWSMRPKRGSHVATPTFTHSKSKPFPRFVQRRSSFDLESLLVAVLMEPIKHRSSTIRCPNFRAEEKEKEIVTGSSGLVAWRGPVLEYEWCANIAQFPQHANPVLNSSYIRSTY